MVRCRTTHSTERVSSIFCFSLRHEFAVPRNSHAQVFSTKERRRKGGQDSFWISNEGRWALHHLHPSSSHRIQCPHWWISGFLLLSSFSPSFCSLLLGLFGAILQWMSHPSYFHSRYHTSFFNVLHVLHSKYGAITPGCTGCSSFQPSSRHLGKRREAIPSTYRSVLKCRHSLEVL